MAKTQEELTKLKTEYETLSSKLKELNDDELGYVTGGIAVGPASYGMTDTMGNIESNIQTVELSLYSKPGAGFKVNIRGIGTIDQSSPLFVVDEGNAEWKSSEPLPTEAGKYKLK